VTFLTDDGPAQVEEVVCLERGEASLATLGLSLAEGKDILRRLQELVLAHQVQAHLDERRPCPHCHRPRTTKDGGTSPFRTPCGKVELPSPCWHQCGGQTQPTSTFRRLSTLLTEPTSPELLYLESKWASLVSYGVTTKLLHEVLPVDEKLSGQTVRNHLYRVAEREEQTLGEEELCPIQSCQLDRDRLPMPDGPLTVGLDGGYVHGRKAAPDPPKVVGADAVPRPSGWFEVITGKSILAFRRDDPEPAEPSMKCFGLVQGYDTKPKRRVYETLLPTGCRRTSR